LLNFHFDPSVYYRVNPFRGREATAPSVLNLLQIDTLRFYLHSKLDCSEKLVDVTRITGTVKGVTGYDVILNDAECHNRVVITNAHATSILTCDRIASQNSRRISRPYSKKMNWLQDL
jgi:hypothetical protein